MRRSPIAALGFVTLAVIVFAAADAAKAWELATPLFLAGTGIGLAVTPLVGTILSSVQPKDAGTVSGIVATAFQVGGSLGVALLPMALFRVPRHVSGPSAYASAFARTPADLRRPGHTIQRLLEAPNDAGEFVAYLRRSRARSGVDELPRARGARGWRPGGAA